MRINDPKILAEFNRSKSDENFDNALVSKEELNNAFIKLDNKFDTLLKGAPSPISPHLPPGVGGYVHKHGYAWLNAEGKVDISLIPVLPISEVHTIDQSVLHAFYTIDPTLSLENLVNLCLKQIATENPKKIFKKGDIIIVVPSQNEQDNSPDFSGSYIITDINPVEGGFIFSFVKFIQNTEYVRRSEYEELLTAFNKLKDYVEAYLPQESSSDSSESSEESSDLP